MHGERLVAGSRQVSQLQHRRLEVDSSAAEGRQPGLHAPLSAAATQPLQSLAAGAAAAAQLSLRTSQLRMQQEQAVTLGLLEWSALLQ